MADEKLMGIPAIPGPKHPDHREIYANTSKVGVGPWDMRLIFGHIKEGANDQQVMEDLMTIVMSPQHAKVLLASWEKAIKTYEDAYGAIPDLTPIVTAMLAKVKN